MVNLTLTYVLTATPLATTGGFVGAKGSILSTVPQYPYLMHQTKELPLT